jgi:pyruvate/2-oxoglutarate dehydrogenase complex dihydrolipoamide acyltransferase (E2) component
VERAEDQRVKTTSESAITAPFAGTVVAIAREPDERVEAGTALLILEAMKMEHEVIAAVDGVVRRVEVAVGETVDEGQLLAVLDPCESNPQPVTADPQPDDETRPGGPRGRPGAPCARSRHGPP